jgi:hypothetical protein
MKLSGCAASSGATRPCGAVPLPWQARQGSNFALPAAGSAALAAAATEIAAAASAVLMIIDRRTYIP